MKHIITLLAIAMSFSIAATAQKLVIGSRVPQLKDLEWLTSTPAKGEAMLIDFFSSANPSCMRAYPLLGPIFAIWDSKLEVVVVSGNDSPELRSLVDADGGRYCFALDGDGSVFTSYGVRYLPFYMLINAKGEMIWQGNITSLTTLTLEDLLK